MLYSVWRQRKQTELLQVIFLAAGVRAPISHARSADFSALFVCGGAALIIIILRATRMLDLEIDNRPMWGICCRYIGDWETRRRGRTMRR